MSNVEPQNHAPNTRFGCPDWCTNHQNNSGHHGTMWRDRYEHSLSLSQLPDDDQGSAIPSMFLTVLRRDDIPQGMTIRVDDARSLADALTRAAAAIESSAPTRCACGEPIEPYENECLQCELEHVRARRAQMRSIQGGVS